MHIDAWLYIDGVAFKKYRLGSVTRLGREANCEICLDDGKISRLHARVDLSGGAFVLTDLSRNGIAVNGRRIQQPVALSQGDRVRLGDTTLTFTFQPPQGPEDETVRRPDGTGESRDDKLAGEVITMLERLMHAWSLRRALVLAKRPGTTEQEVFVGRPEDRAQITEGDREYIATASGGGTVAKMFGLETDHSVAAGAEGDYPFGVVCVPLGEPEIVGIVYLELSHESPRDLLAVRNRTLELLVQALTAALQRR